MIVKKMKIYSNIFGQLNQQKGGFFSGDKLKEWPTSTYVPRRQLVELPVTGGTCKTFNVNLYLFPAFVTVFLSVFAVVFDCVYIALWVEKW